MIRCVQLAQAHQKCYLLQVCSFSKASNRNAQVAQSMQLGLLDDATLLRANTLLQASTLNINEFAETGEPVRPDASL